MLQTEKYDINQKIMHALTQLESRQVLLSITKQARTGKDISNKTRIPLSTVYVILRNLEKLTLAYVERTEPTKNNSKNTKYHKSRIRGIDVSISFSKQELEIILIKNKI